MYSKRAGTSGIRGQLYGTKLMSLLYFRAIHDNDIEEFQLASNIDNIGAFDDICFKAKVKGFDKPVAVFIQAKHRENEKQTLKNDLAIYFDSYLKIRKTFESSNDDLLFNGTFDETECLFVIYTTAKDDLCNDSVTSAFSSKLNSLIYTCGKETGETRDRPDGTRRTAKQPGGTNGTATQPDGTRATPMQPHKKDHVEFLCKIAMKEQITSLAEWIAYLIYDKENFQMMFSNELVVLYHIILAQKVLEISEVQPNGYRIATFRNDFFDANEEYLTLFKDTLFKEILKKRKIEPTDIKNFLNDFLAEPTDVTKLSKLIGTVITYNNGQLDYDKQYTMEFKPQLDKYVPRSTLNEAVELAAKEILLSRHLKVPAAFGNKDLTISGSDEEIEKKFNHLTLRIIDLLDKCKNSDKIDIDESLGDEIQQLNGSIASVIGNIFVLDDNTKLMKITDNCESLGGLARRLYTKLIGEIHDLHDYKFSFKVNKLPKLSFDCCENEENLARDFLKKLLFYSRQADEKGVETALKVEIEDYQRDHPNYFQVKTDAIFLKFHDKIQKWWMHPKQAFYLTRESDFFKKAISTIIEDSLMCSINVTYMCKIKPYIYTFTEDAVRSLNLQDHSNTVIVTENSVLTVVKVVQHLKKTDHVVLDLDYVIKLPTNDRNALRAELANTNENIVLIFVCDKIRNSRNEKRLLENISNAVHVKKTIVITNDIKSVEMLQKYFPKTDNLVHGENSSLVDMTEESQNRILENTRVMFQGTEVRLDSILNDKSKAYVKGDVLNKIICEETIVVGKLIVNRNYNEIKQMYVNRRVKKTGEDINVYFKTLIEGEDDVVLVTAEPGMGKSTLLTHLSLKSKEEYPEVWIVRINLLEYSKEFSKWKEEDTAIDTLETLKFMCQVVLREKHGNDNNVEISLREENDVVYLNDCSGGHWTEFELKLFLNFYDEGKLIFLFDGFDEICPHYTNEVIKCLKTVSSDPRKHRMWVTSRSYSEVKTILQREFGSSYEIENFSYMEMQKYLETFWEYNLRLEELNSAQLENVKNFIEYMSELEDVQHHGFVMLLHSVYTNAAHYLLSEMKRIPLSTYSNNYADSFYSQIKDNDYMSCFQKDNRDGNPLHLLLAADFVESNIKSVNNNTIWNLEANTYTFYERFLETKIKTIRFQEKNEVNIYNPDIIITYDKELANFISKHKKLAAYTIFKMHSHTLFSVKDLDEIKETIASIKKGGEKTGLIYSVADEVPIYNILTEYFAVEYVCDCLKNENDKDMKIQWLHLIFNVMFSMESCMNIRKIFDYKMKTDKTLMDILEKPDEEIFNLIMEQGRLYSEHIVNMYKSYPAKNTGTGRRYWALSDALSQKLHNFLIFFVKILKRYINTTNLNDLLDIVRGSQLLLSAATYKSDVLITFVFDVVREVDETKFTSVLLDNFSFLPHSTISSCVELSSQAIVERIFSYEDCIEPQHVSDSTSSGFSSGPSISSKPSRPSISSLPSRPSTSSLPRQSSTSSLPRQSSTSSLPRQSSTSSLPRQSSKSSLSRQSSTSSLPRQSSTSSLPRQSSKSSLPRQSSTSSLPRQSSTSSLPRQSSTSSLPRRSPTSSLSLQPTTSSRRSL